MVSRLVPDIKGRGTRRQTKQRYHTLALLGLGGGLTLFFTLVQPFYTANLWLSDQLFLAEDPSPNIVIVGIDDTTLNLYGERLTEWSRSRHAQAVNNLKEAGAQTIGFDVLFAGSSQDDEILAAAIHAAGNVVLAMVGTEALGLTEEGVAYQQFLFPTALLEESSRNIGHANITPDRDGTVRYVPLVITDSAGRVYPAFSLAVLHTHFNITLPEEYVPVDSAIYAVARAITVDSSLRLRVNFSVDDNSRPYISYADVIEGNFDHSIVRNKMVLVGMTATGEVDAWKVPTSAGKVPGVFIHADAMDTILNERYLTEADTGTMLLITLLLALIAALVLPRLRLLWGGVLTVVLLGGFLVASFFLFDSGYIMDLLYPILTLPLVFIGNVISQIVIERSDKRFVRDLFGRYVSPEVANEILSLADVGELRLGGEQREVTVLFADMRNFTEASEQMAPEAIVEMLNTYLSVVIDSVLENDGMINKFAGDNVMAVWNAPQFQTDYARLAVKAAGEAQKKIAELQQDDSTRTKVQFGIGINTGDAVAGNVGSSGRAEYTVIGDAVNLASRICSAAPGGEVWIGPETYRQAAEYLEVEEMEPQTFKGKAEPVVVYRVVSWR
ncbi:MAG: adenylate/guanylate cyclase domain-containing protein [Dehalococcoidales bacterium]|nr:MAG: adenylate/guanylate cyclase domain-containing protein [Dehalococcoidales bacterium]